MCQLPNLRCIELSNLRKNTANWPAVPKFCYQTDDLHLSLLSKLTCLTLGGHKHFPDFYTLFTQQLPKLSVLKLVNIDELSFSNFINVLKQSKLPSLSELFVSGCSLEFPEDKTTICSLSLRELEPKHTPRLEKVSLQGLVFSVDELRKASHKLISFQLRELDIRDIYIYRTLITVSQCYKV